MSDSGVPSKPQANGEPPFWVALARSQETLERPRPAGPVATRGPGLGFGALGVRGLGLRGLGSSKFRGLGVWDLRV